MKKINWIAFSFLLTVAGCGSLKITSSWKAQNFVAPEYNKIMVLGLIRDADRTIQENMENHFVGDLKDLGYQAISAYKEYGPKAFDNMNEDTALAKLNNSGVEAVLTVVLLDKKKESKYVPGHLLYSPYGYYYNRFWGYRTTLYNRIYEPGYYVTDTRYFWESNLYDMSTQKLIYSVQTQSFEQNDSETMGHKYSRLIVKNMIKQNVLKNAANITLKPF
ncbi:MAG: hypothetical protein ACXWWC_12735 [Chitinophagaceae bacterium]